LFDFKEIPQRGVFRIKRVLSAFFCGNRCSSSGDMFPAEKPGNEIFPFRVGMKSPGFSYDPNSLAVRSSIEAECILAVM